MYTFFRENRDIAPLLLRIGVGVIFIIAGWGKLTGIEGTQQFFAGIGVPMAAIMAWVVALIEFVGGFMVLIGAYIRIPAFLLACVMIVAIFTVKIDGGWDGMRIDIALLLMSLALIFLGSGRYSVDALITGRSDRRV